MSSRDAAHTVHARVAALPEKLRTAAVAWLRPESDLAAELGSHPASQLLHGVPYVLKDLFDLAAVPTNAGSTFLNSARGTPSRDSALALRLRELGAACAGKTHLVEFAAGLFGDNSHYGDCPHPHFPDRLTGGSSSGSAAMVAAGVVPFAIGTDTGGSVRVPASFCGLFGFRLSPGDDFIRDAMPLSPSLDTAGWLTANAGDMLTAWEALVDQPWRRDHQSRGLAVANISSRGTDGPASKSPRGCYIPTAALGTFFDPEAAAACDRAAAVFAKPADQSTTSALQSSWHGAIEAYTVTALHEAHAIHRDWLAPYHEHYEPSIWQRFTDGGRYTSDQLAGAAATFARVRLTLRQYFDSYDYLVLPATPFPALRKADCTPEARKALLTLTAPASLGGLPVLTVPIALASGLTTGLQVILPEANSTVVPWLLR